MNSGSQLEASQGKTLATTDAKHGPASAGHPSASILSVIIPVFNEETTIRSILDKVLSQPCVMEVICVDDCSSDRTHEVLSEIAKSCPRIRLFRHAVNRGKGAALATGLQAASGEIVIIQDADLEYDPDEYERLIAPIVAGKADVVFGSRFLGAGSHRVLYFWHALGNKFLTTLSNMFTNLNLTDMETCYKVFRRPVIQQIKIEENRFGFEPEVTAKVAKLGVRIFEVAISYYGRTYAEGKKVNWRDGFSAIRCIIKYALLR